MKRQPLIVFSNSFLSLNTWTWIWIYRICDAPDLIDRSPILKTRSRSYDIDSYCLRGFSRRTIITIYITIYIIIYIISISKEHKHSFKRAKIANRNRKQIFNNLNFWYSYVISSYSKFTFSLIQQRLIKLKINTCIYRIFIYIYYLYDPACLLSHRLLQSGTCSFLRYASLDSDRVWMRSVAPQSAPPSQAVKFCLPIEL